jgi:hypothetical protein
MTFKSDRTADVASKTRVLERILERLLASLGWA